jgi:hypothetical protein
MKIERESVKWILLVGVVMVVMSPGFEGTPAKIQGRAPTIGEFLPSLMFVCGIILIVLSGLMRWIFFKK